MKRGVLIYVTLRSKALEVGSLLPDEEGSDTDEGSSEKEPAILEVSLRTDINLAGTTRALGDILWRRNSDRCSTRCERQERGPKRENTEGRERATFLYYLNVREHSDRPTELSTRERRESEASSVTL